MIRAALICTLATGVDELRMKLRGKHLRYLAQHRQSILMGGPTLGQDGRPERMLILAQFPNLAAARAFIANEPYNSAGVFSGVEVRVWNQMLPDAAPGAFDRALAEELAHEKAAE